MNIDTLKYFIDSAELESFSAAATKNFVSQTAISKQFHKLEQELGIKLFTIDHNSIRLTPAGSFFYSKARLLISDLSLAIDQAQQVNNSTIDTLRIGFTTNFEAIIAKEYLLPFQKQSSQVKLFPTQRTYQQSREGLLTETLDIVFAIDYGIEHLLDDPAIKAFPVKEGDMILGMSQDNPLAQKEKISGEELAEVEVGFYNFDGSTPAPFGMIPNARRDGYTIGKTKRFDRLEELILNVSLNNCLTFVPEGFTYPSNPNIVYRHIDNTSHSYKMCIYTNEKNNNPALKKFINTIKNSK